MICLSLLISAPYSYSEEQEEPVPVVIIGGGAAGLSAALYTARTGYETIVFTGDGSALLQIQTIENWPGRAASSGEKLVHDLEQEAQSFGAKIIPESISKVDFSQNPFVLYTTDNKQIKALTVIIATGGQPKKLPIPGVERYWGKGVGVCAICDAPASKDKDVIVVGGSDSAAERAIQLAAYAKQVTMVIREPALQAAARVQENLKKYPTISMLYNTEVTAIEGDKKQVTKVQLKNNKTGKTSRLNTTAVYFAIGFNPRSEIFKEFVNCDNDGYIIVHHPTQKTSCPGIFAAGMVEDKLYGKAGVASGNGIKAALDAINYLEDIGFKPSSKIAPTTESKIPVTKLTTISTQDELDSLVKDSTLPVIIDVFHPLCSTCKTLMPEFENSAKQNKQLVFGTINTAKTPDLMNKLSITSVPTVVVFNHGKLVVQKKIETKQELNDVISQFTSKMD